MPAAELLPPTPPATPPPAAPARPGRVRVAVAVVLAVLLPAAGLVVALVDGPNEGRAAARTVSPVVVTPAVPTTAPKRAPTTADALPPTPGPLPTTTTSPPVRLEIPAIGVDTGLESLGLTADGSLATPSTWPTAGWYAGGVRPGDPGPAIIAGHVDSYQGPAVFYRLDKLKPGDSAVVTRADGSRVTFVVESSAQYPKSQFPTSEVYGPTPTPVLELITCTGTFDRKARSYLDNLVVTAALQPGA